MLPRWLKHGCIAFFLVTIAFSDSRIANAQDPLPCPDIDGSHNALRSEIGINLLGFVHFTYDPVYPRPSFLRLSGPNGIAYKRRFGPNSVRLCIDIFRDSFDENRGTSDADDYFRASGKASRAELRLGFERHFGRWRVRPFATVDLVFRQEHVRLTGEGRGGFLYGAIEPEPYDYNYTAIRYGASPAFGLAMTISQHFSASLESGFLFVLSYRDNSEWNVIRSQVYLDLVRSLSVNYRF